MSRVRHVMASGVRGFPPGFWWLWSSTLVNRLGTFVFPFLTLYLTVERGYSAGGAGLVLSVYGIGATAGALLGGELTDRVGRRTTMAGAQLATAAATAALGLVTQVAAITVLAFAVGAAASVSRPAVSAMITDLVGPADRLRAFSVNYWAINLGFGLSAVAAGFIAQGGYVWLFVGDAVTTLACAIIMWIKLPETRPAAPEPSPTVNRAAKPAAPFAEVLRDARFMGITVLAFVLWIILYQASTSLPVSMADKGLGAHTYGLVIGVNGLLIVLLQMPLTRLVKGHSRRRSLALSAALIGGGFGLTGLAGSAALLYAATVAVWTLGEMIYTPASSAVVADLAPEHSRGRYQGVFGFGSSAATCVAPLVGGLILDHGGSSFLWSACAVLGAAVALAFLLLLPRQRLTDADGAVRETVRKAKAADRGSADKEKTPLA
ncbi:MDR family MFS transporter [Streptomyces liangshanensis]|uniref:MFS transporter n=1 Tax=Streptomyces liangshanensis TaxID=2717324 RepID=A0A6G9GV51_9ACTN|nr:MFS transporter [Streptomyces liangshanensis]QIQ01881.1 MFS transporter [Streptomyces liangshanensis]